MQILQFSLSFETEQRGVRTIIFNALQDRPQEKNKCEKYASKNGFRNLDHMLDWMVFEGPFAALVIMDEIPDNLENVLVQKFQFGVEVLELARYENNQGDRLYRFSPFLADISTDVGVTKEVAAVNRPALEVEEVDTVVVPAREEGFREVFIAEDRWYQIRIHGSMKPQIKYIAVYQIAPISAITHIAPVTSIEPWKDTNNFVVNFSEPASEIGPIPFVPKENNGRVKALQGLRYTSKQRLESAKSLDDVW